MLERDILGRQEKHTMIDVTSAFFYKDHLTARILIDSDHDGLKRPYSPIYQAEYSPTYVEFIDRMIERAREGNLLSRVDTLMSMSYFLERKWPIPESMSTYIAEILQEAVIAFGETEGRVEKKNSAICAAIGLVMPKGAPLTEKNVMRRSTIHSYVWWRMALFDEALFTAATHALRAFDGTGGLSHDLCEKMYTTHEEDRGDMQRFAPSILPFMDLKLHPTEAGAAYGNVVFKDDCFLREIAPYLLQGVPPEDEIPDEIAHFIEALGLTPPLETKPLHR